MKTTYACIAIDYEQIYTICPNVGCKDYIHIYNNTKHDTKNRNLFRKSKCKCDMEKQIKIRVDETTPRISMTYYRNKSITTSRRRFKKQKQIYHPSQTDGIIKKRTGNFTVKFN